MRYVKMQSLLTVNLWDTVRTGESLLLMCNFLLLHISVKDHKGSQHTKAYCS